MFFSFICPSLTGLSHQLSLECSQSDASNQTFFDCRFCFLNTDHVTTPRGVFSLKLDIFMLPRNLFYREKEIDRREGSIKTKSWIYGPLSICFSARILDSENAIQACYQAIEPNEQWNFPGKSRHFIKVSVKPRTCKVDDRTIWNLCSRT